MMVFDAEVEEVPDACSISEVRADCSRILLEDHCSVTSKMRYGGRLRLR